MPISRSLERPAGRIGVALGVAILGVALSEVLLGMFDSNVVAGTLRACALVAAVWLVWPLTPQRWRDKVTGEDEPRAQHLWRVTIVTVLALSALFILTRTLRADVSGTILLLIVAGVIAATYRPEEE